mgnify:FL=1
MEKLLISACLIGSKCRYDGKDNLIESLLDLSSYFDLVPFCPEVEGGLSTPRDPSEIKRGQVKNSKGKDVTSSFYKGAEKAYNICSYLGIKIAILKENSPSCGVHKIHDGNFKGKIVDGEGITTSFLRRKGIKVLNEEEGIEFLNKLKEEERERLAISIEKRKEDELDKEISKTNKKFDGNKNYKRIIDKNKKFERKENRGKRYEGKNGKSFSKNKNSKFTKNKFNKSKPNEKTSFHGNKRINKDYGRKNKEK